MAFTDSVCLDIAWTWRAFYKLPNVNSNTVTNESRKCVQLVKT